ncbi:stage V sporulation protein E [Clostridium beijerinckii]|jgi:cell division protein FtsW|uniref:Probable peptidoglycan glycosyltransferase FtsW n=2 Tax=Clostridium beijerinckii TaxID=1520 RepID=A0AAE2RWE4_CLOBE|nr:stage V sporulation protein E [Clostridium beijerinckii]ABR33757.1 stage V sporulation protein E [Clostridium beijerinckii NCIMB 8052]AIU04175.1 stage V sporulation protein E [Clostridium beijerinckii ATCC 35702]MBF7812179.1 stage V sporulation protein E [Clostridium beijerinckii]NRT24962.1 cell division protein FtsW [Clostridium beijerinckii]NRT67444.1 cell division protein FtsW [Clostridium beijerinckii]
MKVIGSKRKSKMGEIDYGIFYTVALLLTIGVVMVYSASSYYAMFMYKDSMFFLKKELMAGVVGVIAMAVAMSVDYHKIKKYTAIIMIATIPILLAVFLFPGTNGAQRWINLGPLSFQPSELAKYVVVLFLARSLEVKGEGVKDFKTGIVPYLATSGFYAAIVLAEKNLSIASVIMIVTFLVLFAAGGRIKHLFGIVAPALVAAAVAFTVLEPYRMKRLMSFTNPWKDPIGDGYQLIQSFYALGAGGVTGLGLGQSRQKTLYMPEPHNDFIFSIIGEELGLIGCVCIILLFVIFVWRGISVAMKARDTYGTLLAIGITGVVAVQSLINIAVVTGSMPVTGVPLPFISYGGTSLVINMTAIGILLNISRQTEGKDEFKEI